jgi:hypothetical protein
VSAGESDFLGEKCVKFDSKYIMVELNNNDYCFLFSIFHFPFSIFHFLERVGEACSPININLKPSRHAHESFMAHD